MGFCVSEIRWVLNTKELFFSFNYFAQTVVRTFILFLSFIVIIAIIKDSSIIKMICVSLNVMVWVRQFMSNRLLILTY